MEHLVQVAQDLSQARTMDAILEIVRLAARDLTGADGATFVLRDGDQCFYAEENAISPLWKGKRFPMSMCISGWVMEHAEPVFISDIYADSRIPTVAYKPTFVKSLVMVPIREQNPVGAIGNYWARNRTPNKREMAILQALANITALSIENVGLYEQLQHKVSDLENSNAELERFAWIASHDLKSPLRAVDNLASWVQEDIAKTGSEAARNHLTKLRQRTQRMEHMLDDLLEYAMMEDSPMSHETSLISGRMMMNEIEELIHVPDGFSIEMTEGFNAIELYRMPLQRVLMNLVTNAIKHHDRPESGHVMIDASKTAGEITFTVSDDGPGIPPEYHEKLFRMFQTLQPRDRSEGSGMGLAVVKKLVTAQGGAITLRNNSPRGCVFSFSWPVPMPMKGY